MKSKLLIIGVLCAVAFSANAQTEKGKNFINGSIGYSSSNSGSGSSNGNSLLNSGDKTKSFNIMPSFGHFFSNNLAIGLGVGYSNSKITSNSSSVSSPTIVLTSQIIKQNTFNIKPFVKYYVDVADKFKFFGQLTTSIGFGKVDQSVFQSYSSGTQTMNNSFENDYKINSFGASINPGFAFFPSKRWAIEFSFPLLDYSKVKPKDQDPLGSNFPVVESFSFATDSFNPSIGFNFHF